MPIHMPPYSTPHQIQRGEPAARSGAATGRSQVEIPDTDEVRPVVEGEVARELLALAASRR